MGRIIGGSPFNREDPPGAPGRQQRYEGIGGYGEIYRGTQGNTGVGCTGVLGSKGPTGCTGTQGTPGGHEGYNTGCCGVTGISYGYPTTGCCGLSVGVTGAHHSEEGDMSAKNSNRKTLKDKWASECKSSRREVDTEFVELELPPEAYETQTQTVEEPIPAISTAPRPLSRPINRKMTPYDFGKKNG